MPDHTAAGDGQLDLPGVLAALIALLAAVTYLNAAAQLRRRGDRWPRVRQHSFLARAIGSRRRRRLHCPVPSSPHTRSNT